jgi:hypothetical protein
MSLMFKSPIPAVWNRRAIVWFWLIGGHGEESGIRFPEFWKWNGATRNGATPNAPSKSFENQKTNGG